MATITENQKDEKSDCRSVYAFTLILAGIDEITDAIEGAFYKGGCDDALLRIHAGTPYLAFDREADSLSDAITSAIRDVNESGLPVDVIRVVPPGGDTISLFNAYLKLRRETLRGMPPELAAKLDEILQAMGAHNAKVLRDLLKAI